MYVCTHICMYVFIYMYVLVFQRCMCKSTCIDLVTVSHLLIENCLLYTISDALERHLRHGVTQDAVCLSMTFTINAYFASGAPPWFY